MENLFIEGVEEQPTIDFNAETGILEIRDSSYPEYTNEIYSPVMEWLDNFFQEENRKVVFNFKLDYFNTSTSFRFQQIINLLNEYQTNKNGEVTINWYFEHGDIDMQENGEDYAKDAKVPFNLIAYEKTKNKSTGEESSTANE
jgi:hypothetical protein